MKQTYKVATKDLEKIGKLRNITGKELLYLLKKLGITQQQYALMLNPPLSTQAGISYYGNQKNLPLRLVVPLVEKYPPEILLQMLRDWYEELEKKNK